MIFVLYVVIATFIIVQLSLKVIKLRQFHKVSVGYGGNEELQRAISAQLNAVEYLPIGLILLMSLELNMASILLIHAAGIVFITGRILHARGMLTDSMKLRVLGMQITFFMLITLAILNLIYLPYGKMFDF
ncbi:MAG: MAPEG family protein [Thiohalomonadales bacterium]